MYSDFPQLYRGHRKTKYESAMHWGFDCGDGWHQLLYDLSQQLDNYLTLHRSLQCEVVNVKSKFGTLRFRLNLHEPVIQEMILPACNQAAATCEVWGKFSKKLQGYESQSIFGGFVCVGSSSGLLSHSTLFF